MDFLLHDVYLPGFVYDGKSKALTGQTPAQPSHNNNEHSRVPNSLLTFLRDSRAENKNNNNNNNEASYQRAQGQGADNEWQKQVLCLKLRQATCHSDWLSAATQLDHLEGNDAWKSEDESDEYDASVVRAHMQELEDARISCDAGRMLNLVRTTLTRDLGGMGDLRLYKHSRVGTKALIERYIEAALDTMRLLVDLSSPIKSPLLDPREVYEQLLRARQAFGRSALLLSGGGTLGMNHIGVVKALYEARLLPRIISGASAGSIVAAVLCTRVDDEIPQLLSEFCHGDLGVFEREGEEESVLKKAFRFLTKGALFDISNLVRVMRDMIGDMTFQEAYNRTRLILNICVSTASLYELPRLLNYVTAPNVMIWSAVATSCSVPFIFSPAQLLAKDPRTGKEVPWDQSPQRWIDGSVDNDLPMTRLAEMFNVNHFIVSQVNPHVVPFIEKDEIHDVTLPNQSTSIFANGPTWLRTMAGLAKDEALHRMHVLAELGVMPTTMSKMRSVLSQRYSGDITILPEVSYAQFPNVLKNPTPDFMVQAMLSGERATWPKLDQVRNHCAIELALDDAVQRMRTGLVFSKSQIDLRLNTIRADGSNLAGRGKRRQKRRASEENPPIERNLFLSVPEAFRPYSMSMYQPGIKIAGSDLESSSSGIETGPSSGAEEFDYSEDFLTSSPDSLPSPRPQATAWLPRPLSFSVSQPATPTTTSRGFSFSPIKPQTPRVPVPTALDTAGKEPSRPERVYKQIFHRSKTPDVPTIQTHMVDSPTVRDHDAEDISGTRGMVHRKRSLSTGVKGLWPPSRR